jgi:hypothetical protein
MAQSIQTSKFGTLDTSGRIPVFLSGEGEELKESFGLGFTINGTEYVFLPEDRVTKGTVSGNKGAVMVGFLNPTVLDTFKNNSEYIDIAGTELGTSFDVGKFISDKLGGSTKGYIAPKTVYQPIFDAGLTKYDTSLTGPIKGIGNYQGKPVYYGDNGYVEPTGKTTYRQATGQEIIGYTYSSGGGLLAGLGREILKAGPILPLALNFAIPGLGTAVAGGVTAGAIASGDEKTATNYAAQTIAGQLGIGSSVAGATGSTVAGQVAQGTAGGLLAGKNPEQAVTSAVQGVALDSLRPDSGVTVPTEQQALAGQQDLQNQLAPYESTIPPSTTAFDTTTDIPDNSGFDIPTALPQTPITGNTGGNMADETISDDPYAVIDPTTGQYQYSVGDPNFNPYDYQLAETARDTARESGLTVGNVLKFFQSNPNVTKGLIGAGVSAAGGLLTNQANVEAARISAQAMRDAAATAAEAQKFRPVGVTTRFGASQFGFDPTTGQLTSAGYTVSPELKAMQDRIMALSGQGLTEAERAAGRYAPLTAGAQGLFGLGQQYLAQSPEQVAADYMARQQNLLAPSRERQFAQLQNQLFNTGRGGLSVGATGMRPSGAGGLGAASPEMEAYYNALAQQDAALAAQATQAGQQQVQFGAGLLGSGAGLLGSYTQGLTGAYAPFSTGVGVGSSLESLGQAPLDIGAQLGGRSAQAGANVGQTLLQGGLLGARTTQAASGVSPFGTALTRFADSPEAQQALLGMFTGGTEYGTDTRRYNRDTNF